MTIETFGLSQGVPANPEYVRDTLDANDRKLLDIVQAMVDTVRGKINENSGRLARVDKRLRDSINGHLRRNQGLIRPVQESLHGAITNAIDANQGIVNLVSATPQVQDAMLQTPPVPAYGGEIPQLAPPDTATPPVRGLPALPSPLDAQPPRCHFALPPGWIDYRHILVWPPNSPWQSWTAIEEGGSRFLFVDCTNKQPKPVECASPIGRMTHAEIMQWAQSYHVLVYPLTLPGGGAPPPSPGSFPPVPGSAPPSPVGPPGLPPPAPGIGPLPIEQRPPPAPGPIKIIVPPQPAPSGTPPAPPPPPPGMPPSSPPGSGMPQTYLVFVNCSLHQAAAVPNPDLPTVQQLTQEGWFQPSDVPPIYALTPADAQLQLDALLPGLSQLCPM